MCIDSNEWLIILPGKYVTASNFPLGIQLHIYPITIYTITMLHKNKAK